jgi:hypothetical protein
LPLSPVNAVVVGVRHAQTLENRQKSAAPGGQANVCFVPANFDIAAGTRKYLEANAIRMAS